MLALLTTLLLRVTRGEVKRAKDVLDFNDEDFMRLSDQWEEGDEPLPPDELPNWHPDKPKPALSLDMSRYKGMDDFVRASKKGRGAGMVVTISGDPDKDEGEEIASLWQTGLWNNHINTERFMFDNRKAVFYFQDGDLAWEARDYILQQDRCEHIMLEGDSYDGAAKKVKKSNQDL